MGDVTLFEHRNMRGYSVDLHGSFNPENGNFNFGSMRIGPRTEVILYDRSNDLVLFHNGSDGFLKIVDIFAGGNVPETDGLSIRSRKIPRDKSAFVKVVKTGEVESLTPHEEGVSFVLVLILVAIGVMLYRMYGERVTERVKERVNSVFYHE